VPAPYSFDYAVVRVAPRVDREEFVNTGVIVICAEKRFLDAHIHIDEQRLQALWPSLDLALVREHLEAILRICRGDESAGAIARMSQKERFHWLTSPRSTIIQMSPVRTGVTDDPEAVVERLTKQLLLVS
jgi:hypothetical protein